MLVATSLAVAARLLVLASVSYTPLAKQFEKKAQDQRRTVRHALARLSSLSNRCEERCDDLAPQEAPAADTLKSAL